MGGKVVVFGRKIKKDRVYSEIKNIRKELEIIEKWLDRNDEMAGLEIGLAIDEIIMALNRMTECYIEFEDGSRKKISQVEYFLLSTSQ